MGVAERSSGERWQGELSGQAGAPQVRRPTLHVAGKSRQNPTSTLPTKVQTVAVTANEASTARRPLS